jgi:hypothetical protein
MTLAVMGYHFQVMTRRMSEAMDAAVQAGELEESRATEGSGHSIY